MTFFFSITLVSTLAAIGSCEINIWLFGPMKNNYILSPEEEINNFGGRKTPGPPGLDI